MGKRHKKRAACERLRRSGPDRVSFPRSKRTLWCSSDGLFLGKENPLVSSRPVGNLSVGPRKGRVRFGQTSSTPEHLAPATRLGDGPSSVESGQRPLEEFTVRPPSSSALPAGVVIIARTASVCPRRATLDPGP